MNVSVGPRWEAFIAAIVEEGRYDSASEVVREGLRLVEEREAKLSALRETLQDSLNRGGDHDDAAAEAAVEARLDSIFTAPDAT